MHIEHTKKDKKNTGEIQTHAPSAITNHCSSFWKVEECTSGTSTN
jgi:hypothetical protein